MLIRSFFSVIVLVAQAVVAQMPSDSPPTLPAASTASPSATGSPVPQEAVESFPEIYNSEPLTDDLLTPGEALEKLRLPPGFSATLFAAEPDVQNPIAISVDPAGRVWIAENYTYAERTTRFDLTLNDRVLVLEDTNHDGVADKRTVFLDSVKMLTGVVTGQGGVWLMCPPQLLFVPDADGDLIPDGPPQVVLDGFHVARENYHNFANGLSWGPDGWLVGRCGASCPGELGVPGSGDAERVPMRGGMWRYHPQRRVVEALTHGTTNPWGHDWNSVGDLLFINTVNGHLWHAIPGAHFKRSHTIDANPHVYELLDMHADHWHFDTGQGWQASRDGSAAELGGGHAHVGMMIYQDETWPEPYRGKLMTVNMHGRRVNVEKLAAEGSGYVGRHEADFAFSDDLWFRGMELTTCADGNALLIDWSDTGECHDHTGVHRTSGRIYKLRYDPVVALPTPVTIEEPVVLAELQRTGTEWRARRAREVMRSMHLKGADGTAAVELFTLGLNAGTTTVERLRCLWGLSQLDALDETQLLSLLDDADPHIRKWSIRLLLEPQRLDNSDGTRPRASAMDATTKINMNSEMLTRVYLPRLAALARSEPVASVRLELASNLQRLPHRSRIELAKGLLSHAEDADDHNLPLMIWYGLTPLGDDLSLELVELLHECQVPHVQRLIARRVSERGVSQAGLLDRLVSVALQLPQANQTQIVHGIFTGLAGQRQVAMPLGWQKLTDRLRGVNDPSLQQAVQQLEVLFGDGQAIAELMRLAADGKQPLEVRTVALQSLVQARAPELKPLCLKLLGQRYVNSFAAEGLASEADPEIGVELVKRLRTFAPLDRPRVISILASRPTWARSLLMALVTGDIDREEISAAQARQIVNLGEPTLNDLLTEHWGQVRESSTERREQIERWRRELTSDQLAAGNTARGRQLFEKNCGSCHMLFGRGGKLGPDLTGAQRSNIDYLLENIIDPGAVVTKEFRATIVQLEDGRVLTGLVTSHTASLLELATANETYRIPLEEIERMQATTASTMPDGLLTPLSAEEVRDLLSYLQSKQQVD